MNNTTNTKNNTWAIVLGTVLLVVVAFGAWAMLNQPDDRTVGQKIEDAAGKMDEGIDDAARELEDRTPLEKMEDEYNDATDGDVN